MIKIDGKEYELVECPRESSCDGCAFIIRGCVKAMDYADCSPGTGQWYIFKEVKEDGTGTQDS